MMGRHNGSVPGGPKSPVKKDIHASISNSV